MSSWPEKDVKAFFQPLSSGQSLGQPFPPYPSHGVMAFQNPSLELCQSVALVLFAL